MALTDQPYLPLYVDDWMNNNKLKVCSPQAHGVMITVMCIMHKEKEYGKILLRQRFQQKSRQIENFAEQVAKQSSFDVLEILPCLEELVSEEVLLIEGEYLICPRMIKDATLSLIRSKAGRNGAESTNNKKGFAAANDTANAENGIGINNNNTQLVKNSKNGKSKNEQFSGNYKAQGEELLGNRLRNGIEDEIDFGTEKSS